MFSNRNMFMFPDVLIAANWTDLRNVAIRREIEDVAYSCNRLGGAFRDTASLQDSLYVTFLILGSSSPFLGACQLFAALSP
jgi:hypothetical protein